ncbi:MAG: C1 family peptidase [Candidatus Altiarchaeota archaeon]
MVILLGSACSALTGNPVTDSRHVVACLMKLVDQVAPLITFAFFIVGGITYITAVEDRKQRLLAKKYLMMGLTGIICVKIVVAVAGMTPFNLFIGDCPNGPAPPSTTLPFTPTTISPPTTSPPTTSPPTTSPPTTSPPTTSPPTTSPPTTSPPTTSPPTTSPPTTSPSTTSTSTTSPPTTLPLTSLNCPSGIDGIQDQDNTGTCYAHAIEAAVTAAINSDCGQANVLNEAALACSINGNLQAGANTASVLSQQMDCSTSALVTDSCVGSSNPATASCPIDTSGCDPKYYVTGAHTVADNSASIQTALSSGPVIISLNWNYNDWDDGDGTYNGYSGPCAPGYSPCGHAVVIVGYDPSTSTFTIQNSWGAGYGDAGIYHLPASAVTQAVNYGLQVDGVAECP